MNSRNPGTFDLKKRVAHNSKTAAPVPLAQIAAQCACKRGRMKPRALPRPLGGGKSVLVRTLPGRDPDPLCPS